ncbi:MAG: hypothetical protein QNJ98_19500 [Planctomycetota bacterium]|nr:hypothetical protein [Planctomycetota bacterium]
MSRDFLDMLSALSEVSAEYLIVGAHALAAHGTPRAAGDLDIWVRPTRANAARVWRALAAFGAPLTELGEDDLCEPDLELQIGVPPSRVDLLMSISGVAWEETWKGRITAKVSDLEIPVLGRAELIANKRASGRAKDLADIEALLDET